MNGKIQKKAVIILSVIVLFGSAIFISELLGYPLIGSLMTVLIMVISYYLIERTTVIKEQKQFIQKNMLIAKNKIIDQKQLIVLIICDGNIVWANDYAYEEIPQLLKVRSLQEIIPDTKSEITKINNRLYSIERENDTIFLHDVTVQQREISRLKTRQTVLGFLKIDNYDFIQSSMTNEEYVKFQSRVRSLLSECFSKNNIYSQEIDHEKYSLNIPYDVLKSLMNTRFPFVQEIVDTMREEGFDITISMGIAYDFENVKIIGEKAQNALDLAESRGGAQITIFNKEKKKYIGGRISSSKSNIKLRSRIVLNTIISMVGEHEVIYLMAHQKPDYDAISSLMVMYDLLKKTKNLKDKEIKVMVDKNVDQQILNNVDKESFCYDTVVDKTKENIIIIVDTQASDFVSHPKLIDEIEKIIVIDHHQTPENYIGHSLFSWIEPSCSSTIEMIISMIMSIDSKIKNKELATLALKGIITDTNNFRYRSEKNTFQCVSFLLEMGAGMLDAVEPLLPTLEEFETISEIINQKEISDGKIICDLTKEYENITLAKAASNLIDIQGIDLVAVISKLDSSDKYLCKIRTKIKYNSKLLIEEYGGAGHARQGSVLLTHDDKDRLIKKITKEIL